MKIRIAVVVAAFFFALAALSPIPALASPPPAQCTTLAIDSKGPHSVVLTWTNSGEDGMTGTASYYEIRYSTSPITDSNWSSALHVVTGTPGAGGTSACYPVTGLQRDSVYYFAIRFTDIEDQESATSNSPGGTTPHSGPEVSC